MSTVTYKGAVLKVLAEQRDGDGVVLCCVPTTDDGDELAKYPVNLDELRRLTGVHKPSSPLPRVGELWESPDGKQGRVLLLDDTRRYVRFDEWKTWFGVMDVLEKWKLVQQTIGNGFVTQRRDGSGFSVPTPEFDRRVRAAYERGISLSDTQQLPVVQLFTCCRCQLPATGVPVDNGGTMCLDCTREVETRR